MFAKLFVTLSRRGALRCSPWPLAFLLQCSLVGCASALQADTSHSFDDGWIEGRVVRVLPGDELDDPWAWSCAQDSTPQQRTSRTYALVRYRLPRGRIRLVPLPPGQRAEAGDPVWLNLDRCEQALEPRQLPAASK